MRPAKSAAVITLPLYSGRGLHADLSSVRNVNYIVETVKIAPEKTNSTAHNASLHSTIA